MTCVFYPSESSVFEGEVSQTWAPLRRGRTCNSVSCQGTPSQTFTTISKTETE